MSTLVSTCPTPHVCPQIQLLPQSLARKRVWNKKYPICIELARQDDFMSKAQGEKAEGGEDKAPGGGDGGGERCETSGSAEEPRRRTSGGGDLTIYLFGRTGREKEEWFRRFLLASRLKSEDRGGDLAAASKSGELHGISFTRRGHASSSSRVLLSLPTQSEQPLSPHHALRSSAPSDL